MRESDGINGMYFVYDGECPICTKVALGLRLKGKYGELHLLDARQNRDHPIVKQISERNLDLDEGMVLYDGIDFFHGKDALRLIARYGDARDVFSSLLQGLYRSGFLARVTYPFMRATRNRLLARQSCNQIDNLDLKAEPIFKPIFGASWNELPTVMHKHYANHPYSNHCSMVEGTLDVMCAGPVKWLAPLFWAMSGIPPRNEQNVKVTVTFKSDPTSKAFHFDRIFYFKNRKPYRFKSRMIRLQGSDVVEMMASGFGWRMNVVWEDNRVKLKHKGYVLYCLGWFIPLPLTPLLGAGNAEEIAIDEHSFEMSVDITHFIWGKVYEYKGRFTTLEDECQSVS